MNNLKNIFDDKFVEFFLSLKINRPLAILLIIITIGSFLRLYNFDNLLRFNNDQVRDAQIVDTMRLGEEFPLFGPKAGGTKFNLGGAFYYLEYLSGAIFGFSPAGMAFFIPLLSIFSIYLFYVLFKKAFSEHIALGLTFLYAVSFYAIKYSHFAWNPNAIPFFVLVFLLLLTRLLDNQTQYWNFIFLGIAIGIASQLHTPLLILMPLMTSIVIGYAYIKKIKISFSKILLLVFFFILINLPFIYGNFLDGGKNIQEFLAGTANKTSNSLSVFKNITATIEFFLQGSIYYLTGIEPQKNWFNIIKLFQSKNITEILLFITSVFLFLSGLYLLFTKKIDRDKKFFNNSFILILSTFACLSFFLFVLIGNELNIRFFIIVSFIPYLLLGIIATHLNKIIKFKNIQIIIFTVFVLFLTALNMNIYFKTYNLSNYRAPESSYGGISWEELDTLCLNIKNELSQHQKNNPEALVESFSFKKSLEYACLKNHNLNIKSFSQKNNPLNAPFFVITENKNVARNIKYYHKSSNQINSIQIKRFTLLTIRFN